MFGRNKNNQQYNEAARQYVKSIKPELNKIVEMADGYFDKAMAELYGSLYLLHVARSTVDMKHIRPYLGGAMLESMEYFQVETQDIPKRLDYIYLVWDTMVREEKDLRKKGQNPLNGLLHSEALKKLVELGTKKPDFMACLKGHTNLMISRLRVADYSNYIFPWDETLTAAQKAAKDAEEAKKNTEKNTSGIIKRKTIVLRDEDGRLVHFEVMDVILTAGKKYACLLGEGEDMLTILEMEERPDGKVSYISVEDENTLELVFEIFKLRHPQTVG